MAGTAPKTELGRSLVRGLQRMTTAEMEWLLELAEFDERGDWLEDGHVSCVGWLADKCGLARGTAHDKLRVAKQLRRRPWLADAFAGGDISYSKVRAITRIVDADEETDEKLVELARQGTAADLERVVGHWEAIRDQERPDLAARRWERRGIRVTSRHDGMTVIEVVVRPEDADRLMNTLDAYLDRNGGESSAEDTDPLARSTRAQRRVDALVDLIEEALARLIADNAIDPQRAQVDVVVDYDTLFERAERAAELAGGTPLTGEAARRLACDAGLHRLIVRGKCEILDKGRKGRAWSRSQRRAIRFRHRHRCAIRGCDRRITQIHHIELWGWGGETKIELGVPLCFGHHHLVHEGGWSVRYDVVTGVTVLEGPAGQRIESPSRVELELAA